MYLIDFFGALRRPKNSSIIFILPIRLMEVSMLGPIGASLMSIMRVLTPAEIELYIERAKEDKVVAPVAVGAEGEPGDYIDKNRPSTKKFSSQSNDENNFENENVIELFPKEQNDVEEEKVSLISIEEFDSNLNTKESLKNVDVGNSELESIGVYSSATLKEQQRKIEEERKKATPSSSVFLINERRKLKGSQQKLKEQAAIDNYNKNSEIEFIKKEIDLDSEDDQELHSSGVSGILINKKLG